MVPVDVVLAGVDAEAQLVIGKRNLNLLRHEEGRRVGPTERRTRRRRRAIVSARVILVLLHRVELCEQLLQGHRIDEARRIRHLLLERRVARLRIALDAVLCALLLDG